MENQFLRSELLLGADALLALRNARIAVFGLGGVGGYAAEALARTGIGKIDLIDSDTVAETNLNRQIIALHSTLGLPKTQAMAARLRDISPDIEITVHDCFFLPETSDRFDFAQYDCVIDAIDTVKGKIEIIMQAQKAGVPVISCMGTGRKLDPTKLRVCDIYKTQGCPLARVMRYELKKRGVKKLKVVYSEEAPMPHDPDAEARCREQEGGIRRSIPGSLIFVPASAGLLLAQQAVCEITEKARRQAEEK